MTTPEAARRYPTEITPDMRTQWAHLSDAEIAQDALDTLAEIKFHSQLGVHEDDPRIAERRAFVAFLHAVALDRAAACAPLVHGSGQ